uniref:M.musculus myoglobin gene, exon 1 (and joined CDS) n=1 Tax=Mus musculus TaxID=10090 RepID=Q61936_MOUSE|nr:unnamed protein product [Mus musculus]
MAKRRGSVPGRVREYWLPSPCWKCHMLHQGKWWGRRSQGMGGAEGFMEHGSTTLQRKPGASSELGILQVRDLSWLVQPQAQTCCGSFVPLSAGLRASAK